MSTVRNVRDLDTWQVAMNVVELTYKLTGAFPKEERYGLVSQMRRAATSMPSNLAEGQGVRTPRWSMRYVVTAIGSSWELDTQIEVATRLKLAPPAATRDLRASLDRLQKLLYGLRREKERQLALPAGVLILIAALLIELVQ